MREPTDLHTWHPLSRKFAFLAKPKVRRNFIWVPLAVLVVSIALGPWGMDYLRGHSDYMSPWEFFASWAVWGFLSYSFVVLMARPLFALLAKPEGFYSHDEYTGGCERDAILPPSVEPEDHDALEVSSSAASNLASGDPRGAQLTPGGEPYDA